MIHSSLNSVCRTVGVYALAALLLVGCSRETPPRTVVEFVDNPRLLEATMLRCAENRLELKYTQECLNAREAVDRIAAQEDAARRQELEAQSVRKREALRRAQEAAVEARARAQEAERLRREAEYLGQFDENGNATGEAVSPDGQSSLPPAGPDSTQSGNVPPPPDNAPGAIQVEEPQEAERENGSLESVREELQRRQQEADNQ